MEGIVEDRLVLSPAAYFVAANLDGRSDVADIQYAFAKHTGSMLMSEDILKIVEYLDEHGFLATPRFQAIHDKALGAFRAASVREPFLAGKSYPENPNELRAFLDDCLALAERPESTAPPVRCLIAPHIDFGRGARVYGHAYQRLQSQPAPDLAFVFGVAHAGASAPYILTRKGFETPLGLMANAPEIVERIAEGCPWDPFEAELLHRTEHSIEFQVVMLAHVFGPGVRIVPVLCGAPDARPEAAAFLDRCRAVAAENDRRAIVVAGADLAHVGRRFGDPFDIDEEIVEFVRQRDTEDLARVLALDADGFMESVWRDGNARRVCGLGCIHAAMKTAGNLAVRAEMLAYDYAHDPAGGIVSFAAVAIT